MSVKPRQNTFGFDQSDESEGEEEQKSSAPTSSSSSVTQKITVKQAAIVKPLSGDLKRPTDSSADDEYDFVADPKRLRVQEKVVVEKNTVVQRVQAPAKKAADSRRSYTHKWGSDDEEEDAENERRQSAAADNNSNNGAGDEDDDETDDAQTSSSSAAAATASSSSNNHSATLTTSTTLKKTTIKYEVRRAKQCLDQGELKDFQDDLDYFMETLASSEASVGLKCLSMVKLTKRNASFEFRQYLRTKPALFQKLVEYLRDSFESPAFSLCASAFFYMLARDAAQFPARIVPMKLLLEFLKQDKAPMDAEYKTYQTSIWETIQEWKADCEKRKERSIVFDVTEKTLSAGYLALVTLDYVIARAPTKNKRLQADLLNLGFFQTLIAKVDKLVLSLKLQRNPNAETLLQHLYELEHSLRILENGIVFEKRNQMFLVGHRNGLLLFSCEKYLDYFCQEVPKYEVGSLVSRQLLYVISLVFRLTMNASHSNDVCALKLGQIGNFFSNTIQVLVNVGPRYAEKDKQMDLTLLLCGLLVNVTEKSPANRRKISNMRLKTCLFNDDPPNEPNANVEDANEKTPQKVDVNEEEVEEKTLLEVLVKKFLRHESMARIVDEELDNELLEEVPEEDAAAGAGSDQEEDSDRLIRPADMNEDEIVNALHSVMKKATSHMHDSMIASYTALLIGCLVQTDEAMAEKLRSLLPEGDIAPMLEQLERFREFAELTKIVDVTCISNVIQSLKVVGGKESH